MPEIPELVRIPLSVRKDQQMEPILFSHTFQKFPEILVVQKGLSAQDLKEDALLREAVQRIEPLLNGVVVEGMVPTVALPVAFEIDIDSAVFAGVITPLGNGPEDPGAIL